MQQILCGSMHMLNKPKTFDIEGSHLKLAFDWLVDNPTYILHVDKIVELITAARLDQTDGWNIFQPGDNVQKFVIPHNAKNSMDSSIAERPLRMLSVISPIQYMRGKISDKKVLSIGPRTEAEIIGLLRLGYDIKNIECLGLISYSPYSTKGDMHDLPYENNTFDLIVGGWVLAYSSDNQRVADEMLRVGKPGALIAIGCNGEPLGIPYWAEAEIKSEWYTGGVPCLKENDNEYDQDDKVVYRFWNTGQIHRLFSGHIRAFFFNYDRQPDDKTDRRVELITVFRIT